MTILLTLFFGSLLGITLMIGRKVMALQVEDSRKLHLDGFVFEIPHLDSFKELTMKELKKYGYATLVMTLKAYVKSANILKEQYRDLITMLENAKNRNIPESQLEAVERKASGFLEMISEYKHKIRKIKHRIAEEERKNS
jgi:hypothetical protein